MQRKALLFLFAALAVTLLAPVAFAADQPAAAAATNWVAFAKALGFGIALAGCGIGQGRTAAAACEGFARNPAAAALIRVGFILGLVFIETLALYFFVSLFITLK
jgi:F-type H+-transporting ATPase subunit c